MDKRTLICLILRGLDAEGNLVSELDLGINKDEYLQTLDLMQKDRLIDGLKFLKSSKDNRIIGIALNCTEITADGMQYLNDNWFYSL
jgi:hypothetical protein